MLRLKTIAALGRHVKYSILTIFFKLLPHLRRFIYLLFKLFFHFSQPKGIRKLIVSEHNPELLLTA